MTDLVVCADFGSTFTKVVVVDADRAMLLATAQHPTTLGTDLLDGYDACLAELSTRIDGLAAAEVLACSSAGGGLRIAVIGHEELVTAEAGRRVALSSGGKVVAVLSSERQPGAFEQLRTTVRPDVLLLTGGTDGGEDEAILRAAAEVAASSWAGPVVVAGNIEVSDRVSAVLGEIPHVLADNVVPRIGVLAPDSARAAIREMFLAHVIGGKELSKRAEFTEMIRGATPDVVLAGVELLCRTASPGKGVTVVDIGGATTDVHSAIPVDPQDAELSREVVAPTPVTRTVEGDLGMRWSATSTVAAAVEAGLDPVGVDLAELAHAAARRTLDPAYLPQSPAERTEDEAIATAALVLALQRHAGRSRIVFGPGGKLIERTGRDLREVELLIGSGGVLRTSPPAVAERVLRAGTGPTPDGWQLPGTPRVLVDTDYVLAAIGLLSLSRTPLAERLVGNLTWWQ